ncbi:ABC transporter permease [Asticcacaulis endophyticus]|jgi:ABC-2 type transport system permease protein|uniref:Sugar ABC transporter permease n=1 Tax=Asticcacaulis endophyticus TaxID=1395890 RepID=A0A918UPR4_9CAUL|nr:ABC transporter permease [Asticcacaulis endophyticus]GGZ25644.1 sugar ABC transporter permease [Asticcacaulis endophyticus]
MGMMKSAITDIKSSIDRFDLIWALVVDDLKQRYRRTVLGPFWVVIGIGLWVSMTGFVGMALFNADLKDYFTQVAVGMVLWIFLVGLLNEGVTLLQSNGSFILNTNMPLSLYIIRALLKNVALFLHYLVIPAIVIVALGVSFTPQVLLAIPFFMLYAFSGLCLVTILCFLCTRFRDLQQAVTALLQIVPIVTPILWSREFLPDDKKWIADVNPLYHYIHVIKASLIGQPIEALSVTVVVTSTVVLAFIAFTVFTLCGRKSVYWL